MAIEDYRTEFFKILDYQPTPPQDLIHSSNHRIKLVAGGERGGKSTVGSKEATLHGLLQPGDKLDSRGLLKKLVWIVGPEFDIARPEFEYCLTDFTRLHQVADVSFPKQGPCSILLKTGTRIVSKSAKEPEKLGMEAPDFILVCEAAQISYEAYLRLRGRIAEKRAPMVLTGTFEGSVGWYPEFFTRWQAANSEDGKSFSLPSWENSVIYPGGREDPEIKRLEAETPHDLFMERYAGVPCPPTGLIMKEFANTIHVGEYDFNPDLPVDIAVDPGYAGAHAVLAIQEKGDIVYLIDEIYLQGYVTEEIIDICKQKKWWHKVEGGAIDIAAKQHQAQAAPIEVWQKNVQLYLKTKKVEVEGGINLLRTFLKVNPVVNKPKLYVNHSCRGFISECGGGKSPVIGGGAWLRDVNTGKVIDRNNHACKAVIYWLVSRFGYGVREGKSSWGMAYTRNERGEAIPVRR